ncbi:MAG TPA: 30S ribosomal protein S20, partial [Firmicutes bacterium]|nr:30S ribosomal protein S20 [Bacillota bacterium]
MANSKAALKRVKINEVKRARNISAKSSIKT